MTPHLYRRLLGDAWMRLAPAVQALHAGNVAVRYQGVFSVERCSSPIVNAVLKPMGLPDAGSSVALTLVITPDGNGETWHRTFAGKDFITYQTEGKSQLMRETTGSAELWFRLAEE